MVIRAAQWLGKGDPKPLTTQTVRVDPVPIEHEAPSSASSPPSKPTPSSRPEPPNRNGSLFPPLSRILL